MPKVNVDKNSAYRVVRDRATLEQAGLSQVWKTYLQVV